MSVPLAVRVIASYTSLGDLVVIADASDGDGAGLLAAARLDRRAVGFATTRPQASQLRYRLAVACHRDQRARVEVCVGAVAAGVHTLSGATGPLAAAVQLVLAAGHDTGGSPAAPHADLYQACVRLLAPGGVLVVHTHSQPDPDGGPMAHPHGRIVRDATSAGLVYLQHVVVLHTSIRGGRLHPPGRANPAGWHQRVHSDLLVFHQPNNPTSPPSPRRASPHRPHSRQGGVVD